MTKKISYCIFLLALFLLLVVRTTTADQEDEPLRLKEIVVTEKRIVSEREAENPSKFLEVIDVEEKAGQKVETVTDVLEESVGVQVKRWGGLGSFATVSVRGASASQVEVYLDGVPLNRAWSGIANIGDLAIDSFSQIEVFRGSSPVDFSSAGIGGVVNLKTRKKEGEGNRFTVSMGSFDTYKLNLSRWENFENWNYLIFLGHLQSEGDFKFENDNGTPLNSDDDFEDTRVNNDFQSNDLVTRFGFDASGWENQIILRGHYKDQGMPGPHTVQAEHTRFTTKHAMLAYSSRKHSLAGGKFDLELGADGFWMEEGYSDTKGEVGLGRRENRNTTYTYGLHTNFSWFPGKFSESVQGCFSLREEEFHPLNLFPEREEGKVQSRWFATSAIESEFVYRKLGIIPSLRHQHYWSEIEGDPYFSWAEAAGEAKEEDDFFSPSLGAWIYLGKGLVFKGNYGVYWRMPTFFELFGDRGTTVGNTSLEPERGENFDLGLRWQMENTGIIDRMDLEWCYYQSQIEDMIIFFQNSQRTIRAINIGAAYIWGHEFRFLLDLQGGLDLSGNYTYQIAMDQGDVSYWQDKALPFRPTHEAYLRLGYSASEKWKTWIDFNYMGENYWDRANAFPVPERKILDIGVGFYPPFRKYHLAFSFEVNNLLDEQISDIAGYPMPGRTCFATAELKF